MKTFFLFLSIILFFYSCVVLDFSDSTWMGTAKSNSYVDFKDDRCDYSSTFYYGRRPRLIIIPFFSFEWSTDDFGVGVDFSTDCDKYKKIDSIAYEISSRSDTLIQYGKIINDEKKFTCYSDSSFNGKSTRCYISIISDFNIKQTLIDSIAYYANFIVYLTDSNGASLSLKYSDCSLSKMEKKKIKFIIIENY